ncbi:Alpha/Beta hydrolase protein [Pestalotiopsis sp. NC0098]|nr:Alpha/Beta hydrolase protein [Pestalotiopsis sp. NC0098]
MTRFTSLRVLLQVLLIAIFCQKAFGRGLEYRSVGENNDPGQGNKPNPPKRPCVHLTIPVQVTAEVFKFAKSEQVRNNIEAIDFNLRTDSADFKNPVMGRKNITGLYDISAMFCSPHHKPTALIIPTHGVSFDRSYWDPEYRPDLYSFVDYAMEQDYSVLIYDRLGNGKSSKPHGVEEVQSAMHVEILNYLTDLARSGELFRKSKKIYFGEEMPVAPNYRADKVIHVGHSYGSALMLMALAKYPAMSDAAVLTGYMPAKQPYAPKMGLFNFQHAAQSYPQGLRDRPHSYLTLGSKSNFHYLFVASDTFDEGALDYFWDHRQSGTVGEILSSIGFIMSGKGDVSKVKSPVLFFTGQKDRAFCPGTTCETQLDKNFLRAMFNGSSHVDAYLQPGTGHLLTTAVNASAGHEEIFRWITAVGL